MSEHAVHEKLAAYIHRQKHAGITATGANGINERATTKDHAITRDEISRGDG
jgi:stage V sporulation protein SpoVS